MDVSRFRVGDWVLAIAGAVMLTFGLAVNWASVHAAGRDLGGARNAFDYPITGGLAWLLVVAAGLLAFLLAAGLVLPGHTPWARILVGATGLAAVLMIVRVALGGGADERIGNQVVTLERGPGMWIALVAALAATAGAVSNLYAEGQTLATMFGTPGTTKGAAREPRP